MRTGQDSGLDADGSNLVEGATIGTDAVFRHLLAEEPFNQMLVIGRKLLLRTGIIGGKRSRELILDLLDQRIALGLAVSLRILRILRDDRQPSS